MGSSSGWRTAAASFVLVALASAQSTRFETILWRHGGPRLDARIAARLQRAGVSAVSVDQGEDPARMRELGLRFYLDHAAGKGTLHLREPEFRAALEAYERSRDPKHLVRPRSLHDADVRRSLLELLRKRVPRAKRHGALMISLDDEISTTRFATPLDFCFSKSSLTAFREFVRARYGKLARLSQAWGREVASFEQLRPPTTDEVRAREFGAEWPKNLADWNDHREFMDASMQELLGLLCNESRRLAPKTPVGFEGGQAPAAFGGWDWSRLLTHVDYVEPYDIGGAREVVRSLRSAGTKHFETIFPPEDPRQLELSVARLYDAFAHGLSGVVLWSSGRFMNDNGTLTGFGQRLSVELPRLSGPAGAALAGAEVYAGEVAILESQASVRLHWMLDSRKDGETWLRRFATHEREHSTAIAARVSWIRLLQDLGFAFRFVTPRDLRRDKFGGGRRPKVLILPSALALGDESLRAIETFARDGGLVIADETPARYSDRLVRRERPALDAFFGIERGAARRHLSGGRVGNAATRLASRLAVVETGIAPQGITIARQAGALRSGGLLRSLASSAPAAWCQFERPVGRGRAVLLNLAVHEYWRKRLREDSVAMCRDLRSRVRKLFVKSGVDETALVRVRGFPTIVERLVLTKGKDRILVVRANCLESPELFKKLVDRGPRPMTIVLPIAVRLRDLWTGKVIGRPGRRIEARLDLVRGSFFRIEAF